MDGLDVTALIERWIFSIHIGYYLWLLFCYPQVWEDEEMSSRRGLIHPSCLKAEENGSEIFRLHYNCKRRMSHPARPHAQSYMCGALTLTKSPSSDLDDLQHHNVAEWIVLFVCVWVSGVSGFTALTTLSVRYQAAPWCSSDRSPRSPAVHHDLGTLRKEEARVKTIWTNILD